MVKLTSELILNPLYEELQKKLEALTEQYANALADYAQFTTVVRKNLEASYLTTIGKKEHRLFTAKIQMLQLKRKISLIQAAVNRGEHLSKDNLELAIQQEFEEYRRQLETQQQNIKQAQEYALSPKLSAKKNKRITDLYHQLVKKLHPDLHPDLPPAAAELWQRVVDAYSSFDWQELIMLGDLVDEVLKGNAEHNTPLNSLEKLQAQIEQLEDKISALDKKRSELKTKPPYCYEKLLEDPSAVMEKREELDKQIADVETNCEQLQKILDLLWLTP